MLKTIKKIEEFGSFKNFDADEDLNKFSKYNLIFGYNGTGKTTLSNFLRCLGSAETFCDYKDCFQVITSDCGFKKFADTIYKGKVKVFNRDFVEKSLTLNDATANAITYDIGEISPALKKEKDKLENLIKNKQIKVGNEVKLKISKLLQDKDNGLEDVFANISKDIRADLNIIPQSYNSAAFKRAFNLYKDEAIAVTLKIKDDNACLYKTKSKPKITFNVQSIIDNILLESKFNIITEQLKECVSRKADIKEELAKWIEDGLSLHSSKSGQCEFCGNTNIQWDERFKYLKELISTDDVYEIFSQKINELYEHINALYNLAISPNFIPGITKDDFLIFDENIDPLLAQIKTKHSDYIEFLTKLKKAIEDKKGLKDKAIVFVESYSLMQEYKNLFQQLKILTDKNDENVDALESNKKAAFENVVKYYIKENKDKVEKLETLILKMKKVEDIIKGDCELKKQRINEIDIELDSQNAPIDEIQKYLSIVFGHKRFSFNYLPTEKSYQIIRDGEAVAKNLSEGEKTVIAFSYFLATLNEKSFNLKDSLIVIDDPISSLDQQYLFNLSNLICSKFASSKTFKQLFILTHNFYFFRKIRNVLLNKQLEYEKLEIEKQRKNEEYKDIIPLVSIYEIKNINETGSTIINADKYLMRFESEYQHIAQTLKSIYDSPEEIKDTQTGNMIRKLLEIFLAYQSPNEKGLYSRFRKALEKITSSDKEKYSYLEGLSNATSHTDEIADLSVLEEISIPLGKIEIKQLFKFISEVDEEHAKKLKIFIP